MVSHGIIYQHKLYLTTQKYYIQSKNNKCTIIEGLHIMRNLNITVNTQTIHLYK